MHIAQEGNEWKKLTQNKSVKLNRCNRRLYKFVLVSNDCPGNVDVHELGKVVIIKKNKYLHRKSEGTL